MIISIQCHIGSLVQWSLWFKTTEELNNTFYNVQITIQTCRLIPSHFNWLILSTRIFHLFFQSCSKSTTILHSVYYAEKNERVDVPMSTPKSPFQLWRRLWRPRTKESVTVIQNTYIHTLLYTHQCDSQLLVKPSSAFTWVAHWLCKPDEWLVQNCVWPDDLPDEQSLTLFPSSTAS